MAAVPVMPQTCGYSADQVLQRDLAQNHALRLGRHALLGFDGGVQPGRPAAVLRDPALELVHHLDGAVLDHVIHVAAQQRVGMQRVLHGGVDGQIAALRRDCRSASASSTARMPASVSATLCAPMSMVKCSPSAESAHHLVGDVGQAAVARIAARDHQRNARLVDQDGIGLVDHGGGERPVDLLLRDAAPAGRAGSRSRSRWRSRT